MINIRYVYRNEETSNNSRLPWLLIRLCALWCMVVVALACWVCCVLFFARFSCLVFVLLVRGTLFYFALCLFASLWPNFGVWYVEYTYIWIKCCLSLSIQSHTALSESVMSVWVYALYCIHVINRDIKYSIYVMKMRLPQMLAYVTSIVSIALNDICDKYMSHRPYL